MALEYWGINKGVTGSQGTPAVLMQNTPTGRDVELGVDLAVFLAKGDVVIKMEELRNFILGYKWPAATAAQLTARFGLAKGQQGWQTSVAVAAFASLVNQGLTYTALLAGTGGNAITIALVDPSADNHALVISVTGNAITATLATGSGGAITTTRATLQAALAANAQVAALISITGGSGTLITALSATNLTGGAIPAATSQDIYFDIKIAALLGRTDFENAVTKLRDSVLKGKWLPA